MAIKALGLCVLRAEQRASVGRTRARSNCTLNIADERCRERATQAFAKTNAADQARRVGEASRKLWAEVRLPTDCDVGAYVRGPEGVAADGALLVGSPKPPHEHPSRSAEHRQNLAKTQDPLGSS